MARQDLKGTAVAPGVGIGIARVVVEAGAQKVPRRTLPAEHVAAALLDFEAARERAMAGLRHIQSLTAREFGIQDAAIYGAQIAVLQDPDALGRIRKMVGDDSLEPASAIQALVDRFESTFRALEGGEVKNWAADLRDPWFAVLRELGEIGSLPSDSPAGEPLVLVADELTPSLVTRYPRGLVAGIVAARGGRFSHGAVLARTFSIPTVIGVDGVHARARHGEACVVYGDEGRVLLGADAGQQEDARVFAKERAEVREVFLARGLEACSTSCGESVGVYVNIESPRDLETFDTGMADGVGLFRTEFAYMERPNFPSGKEQTRIYESVLAGFVGKPVVFRTLDIGGDKPLRYFQTPRENNPALGWRGLRVSLEWKDLFLLQLKALAEARAAGDVRVLLPMVTTLDELREARALVDQVHRDSDGRLPKLPLGVMIEVPAAAMALRDLAREADFVSVGSNDLTQYLFAVDR
ncbi:MAG TPA: putative PEP-binding protein, partial [Planctomycetota bacterium]